MDWSYTARSVSVRRLGLCHNGPSHSGRRAEGADAAKSPGLARATRGLLKVTLPPEAEGRAAVKDLVERLMGRNPEHRFHFIQNRAGELDPELIDA